MNEVIALIQLKLRQWWQAQIRKTKQYVLAHKLQLGAIIVLVYIASRHDLNFELGNFSFAHKTTRSESIEQLSMSSVIADIVGSVRPKIEKDIVKPVKSIQTKNVSTNPRILGKADEGNTYSNVSFWSGKTTKSSIRKNRQYDYIQRYAKIAQAEMQKFGIPASIILAQGILESNAGESRLAMQNNNHFGVKCFSQNCQKGHCTNFTDDSHKDFFRVYSSPWESYRAHSIMLKTKHYKVLLRYGTRDYRNWAVGLQKLGYATDRHYAQSLINTIEDLKLHEFDR